MTVRLALLGCGSHFHNEHLPALRRLRDEAPNRAVVVAVCDRDRDLAVRVAAEFPQSEVYDDLSELLAAGDLMALLQRRQLPALRRLLKLLWPLACRC